ncbi:O-unit flippase-like protein [Enterococcus nangangensis]
MMKIKATKSDIIWNYVGVVMSMASNFLLLPFMMFFIDSSYLGLWYVYLSIGGIVILFDFGFNPTLARNIAFCWSGAQTLNSEGATHVRNSSPNFLLLEKVINTCKKIYLIIALLALSVLLTIGSGYIYYISSDIFDFSVILSWGIYSIAIFFNLYYGYYATLLRGVGAISEYNKINILARFIQIVVSIVLMALGLGIVAVSGAYLLYGFLLRLFSKRSFYQYKNIGNNLGGNKKTSSEEIKMLFSIIWHNAWRDGVVAFANYLSSQASTLIASFFLTLEEVGVYSISVQLVTAIATISAALYTAYQPSLQGAYINQDTKESEKLMGTAMTAYALLFIIGVVLLLAVGIPILKIVKPTILFSPSVIIGIAIYNFFYKRQSYYASFISNTNSVPYMKAYIVSGFFGILLSIAFIKVLSFGIWGLILGQFIPQLVYNCWKWPKKVFLMLDSSAKKMFIIGIQNIFEKLRKITLNNAEKE